MRISKSKMKNKWKRAVEPKIYKTYLSKTKVYTSHLRNYEKRDFLKKINGQLVFKARFLLCGNFTVLTLKVTSLPQYIPRPMNFCCMYL